MEQFYRNLPILVTGGAGFIGSHLVYKLVQLGANVTVIDTIETGSLENLEPIIKNITFIHESITSRKSCFKATKNKKIIFHLAALVSVPESMKNPRQCHEINVNGTFNLLEAARINNVERFVFSSSSAVYGTQSSLCQEDMPCHPISLYGTSKRIGELLCKQYAENFGLQTTCLRYFNVFGDRQNPNGAYAAVIAKFRKQMSQHLPITIFGDGLQTRDFIHVKEVVHANLILGMQSNMQGDIFNIATGKGINLLELIETIKKEFPEYNQSPQFAPARKGDIKYSVANASKWKKICNNKSL